MRQNQYAVSIVLAGRDLGVWATKDGGEVDSEDSSHRPGGMGDPIPLGGSITTGNVTTSKLYDDVIHDELAFLYAQAGVGDGTIVVQRLDASKAAAGRPTQYRVKLKRVQEPDVDSESDDAAMLECEWTVFGRPTVL